MRPFSVFAALLLSYGSTANAEVNVGGFQCDLLDGYVTKLTQYSIPPPPVWCGLEFGKSVNEQRDTLTRPWQAPLNIEWEIGRDDLDLHP